MEKKSFTNDDLYRNLDRIHSWIDNCETKTSIVIGFVSIFFAILLASDSVKMIHDIFEDMLKVFSIWSLIFLVSVMFSLVVLVIGCFELLRLLSLRSKPEDYCQKEIDKDSRNKIVTTSLLYFREISKRSYAAFYYEIENCDDKSLRDDLISQIHICSKICQEKFQHYVKGFRLSLIGGCLCISMIIIGFYAF